MLDFVYPPLCLGCNSLIEPGQVVCPDCMSRLDKYDYPICQKCLYPVMRGILCPECKESGFLLFAYADYSGPLKEIIKQFKFKGITAPAEQFARLIVDRFGPWLESFDADLLVPIPLYRTREYTRGYNQAALFAIQLGELLTVPVDETLIVREKSRKPQAKLEASDREDNIKDVFRACESTETVKRLILIDDVVTTGATIREAKHVLEEAGYTIPAAIALAT